MFCYSKKLIKNRSFTLIEMLITICIIGVVLGVAVVAINPAELFKESRDSKRENDLNIIYSALQVANNKDLNMGICDGTKIYSSLSSSHPLSNDNLPNGMSWVQVSSADSRRTDGNGWIPINFNALGGAIFLPVLPVDPKNNSDDNLFYTYTCNSSNQYVLTAWLESKHYGLCDPDLAFEKDGGSDPYLYEIGSNLFINSLKPIDFWALNEGVGEKVNGSSGHIGELNNNPAWTLGRCGNAINVGCGGTIQSYANIQDADNIFDGMSQLSVEAWAYPAGSNSNFDGIVSKYHDQGNGISYYLKRDGATLTWAIKTDDITEINVPDIFYDNYWYHLVGTYDGSNMRLYVNGEQVGATTPKTGIVFDTNADIAIGRLVHSDVSNYGNCNNNGVRGFIGKIENVSIYNRALSLSEVYRHYKLSQY